MLSIIMNASGLYDFGVCDYKEVGGRLLNCMAKGRLPDSPESIISVLFPYKVPMKKGNLSLYAAVPDYHEIAGHMLTVVCDALSKVFPEHKFVWFIDNSPIPEVLAASISGLGDIGDNGLLINKDYGTFCFIGEIVTNLEIPATGSAATFCEHCGRCVSSCPGGALAGGEGGGFNRELCISHITQKKGELTAAEAGLVRQVGSVWGCDICQNVCPHNEHARDTYIAAFIDKANPDVTKNGLATAASDRAYMWRGKAPVERNLKIFDDEE
jgi:epoxyqueuosine reductase QueG